MGAGGALVVALLLVLDEPSGRTSYLRSCGRVVDWVGRQDSVCNEPLLDRGVVAGALLGVTALLIPELRRTEPAVTSRPVRAVNVAIAAVASTVALVWADAVTNGTARPSGGALVVGGALLLGSLAVLPAGGSTARTDRWLAPVLVVAWAAVLAVYAVRLWSGNGA